jgi:hypothetical protein
MLDYDTIRFSVNPAHRKREKDFNELRHFGVSCHTPSGNNGY